MSRRRGLSRRAVALGAFCALAVARAGATDSTVALRYDVHFGPFHLLSVATTSTLGPLDYHMQSRMQTEGIVGLLFPWTSDSEAAGSREDATLRPLRFRSEGRYRGELRLVQIDYGQDGALRTRVEPAAAVDARDVVPDALQRATIDPLTAGLASVLAACRGTLGVFDGRRRYDLRFEELGPADLPRARRRLYAGPARRCRAAVVAHAGFWRTNPRYSETPTHLDFWIASPAPDIEPVPVYLELAGARGTLRIDLTEARAIASAPSP